MILFLFGFYFRYFLNRYFCFYYYYWYFFIVGAFVIAKDSVRSLTRKKDSRTDIEAGAILSECVINTKTIFSFNFQKPAVDMYLGLLLTETSDYVKDSLNDYFDQLLNKEY